jgi:hypothetical protein
LSVVCCLHDKVVQLATSGADCAVVPLVDRAQVAKSAEEAIDLALHLSLFQSGYLVIR